jgi:hypothetical protein
MHAKDEDSYKIVFECLNMCVVVDERTMGE